MRIQKTLSLSGLLFAAHLSLSAMGYAAVINVTSCAQAAIQAAINSAATGDTVSVPSGSATWTTNVTIPNGKKITLAGAGATATLITGSGIGMNQSGSRVTGFGFSGSNINVDGHGWRIDHCSFSSTAFAEAVSAYGQSLNEYPTGLIDNCTFTNMRVLVLGSEAMFGDSIGTTQHWIWAQPLNMGTADAVYVEDCSFNDSGVSIANAIDADYGGRVCFPP